MAANIVVVADADPINYYFRNYAYADILSDMPILSLGLASDLNKLMYKDGVGVEYKIMVDSSGAANLTADRVMVTVTGGKAAVSSVTTTEIGYVSGVTSGIQSQIDAIEAIWTDATTPDRKYYDGVPLVVGSSTESSLSEVTIVREDGDFEAPLRLVYSNTTGGWEHSALKLERKTTGIVDDATGISVDYYLNSNYLGKIGYSRDGVDTSGKCTIYISATGSNVPAMEIKESIIDTVNRPIKITRGGTSPSVIEKLLILDNEGGGSITDSFGVGIAFKISDNVDSSPTEVCNLSAVRDGADNIGKLVFGVGLGATEKEHELTKQGLNLAAGTALTVDGVNIYDKTKDPTGFVDPSLVVVTYDDTARTVTLTGTVEAYYRGAIVNELISGWVSPAHSASNGTYYLTWQGGTGGSPQWSTTPFDYSDIQIALSRIGLFNFCLREPHGINLSYKAHENSHDNFGTYTYSGGDFTSYVYDSTTAADRRPNISSLLIKDEDNPSQLAALTSNLYTHSYLTGTNAANETVDDLEIIALSGNRPYWNQNNGGTYQQTLMSNNYYAKIFVMAVPVSEGVECQKRRFLFIQPQAEYQNEHDAVAVTASSVDMGDLSAELPEMVYCGEVVIKYTSSNWVIVLINKLIGNKVSQIAQSSGGSTIWTDSLTPTLRKYYSGVDLVVGSSSEGTTNKFTAVNEDGDSEAPIKSVYSSTDTAGRRSLMKLVNKTSGDMVDGFGCSVAFEIEDSGATEQIADISAVRNGADNTGKIVLTVREGGFNIPSLEVTPTNINTINRPINIKRIGTSPSVIEKVLVLDNEGDGSITDSFGVGIAFKISDNVDSSPTEVCNISAVRDGGDSFGKLVFGVGSGGNTEMVYITNEGVGINQPIPFDGKSASSGGMLHIKGSTTYKSTGSYQLMLESDTDNYPGIFFKGTSGNHFALRSGNGDGLQYMSFNSSTDTATLVLSILENGDIISPSTYSNTVTGSQLYVASNGEIGVLSSSLRYKNIIEENPSTEWLFDERLKSIIFTYKTGSGEQFYGLLAEDMNEVNKRLVVYNKNGVPNGINYDRLITPLLQAVREGKKERDEMKSEIAELKQMVKDLLNKQTIN